MRPHVLVVDDAVEELHGLIALLQKHFRLSFAADGRRGFDRAAALRPDLILLDVLMPGMSGFAVCRILKSHATTKDVPVIFLSARCSPQERVDGFLCGAVDFVAKPFLPEEVLARIWIHTGLGGPARSEQANASRLEEIALHAVDARLLGAVHYICSHLGEPLNISRIAKIADVHEKGLMRLFRTSLGITVAHFIAEQRMHRARALLVDTNLSIQDIACEVGFSSPGNFATAFRQRNGVPPNMYRQSARSSDARA